MMTTLPAAIQDMMRALSQFDADLYASCFADEFVCREPVSGVTTDRDELRPHVTTSEQNWSSFEVDVTDVLGHDDHWALAYTCVLHGRANGFDGVDVRLDCIAIVRLAADGRIAEWNEQYDTGVLRRARRA